MVFIPRALRNAVVLRAKGLCEYCQTAQAIVIEMEIDHIIPERAGGLTVASNLCLSCISCNSHKGKAETGWDAETSEMHSLFNPRTQRWNDHFKWSEDGSRVLGLTPIGRATIDRLQMNRELVVQARLRWVEAGWHPPTQPAERA